MIVCSERNFFSILCQIVAPAFSLLICIGAMISWLFEPVDKVGLVIAIVLFAIYALIMLIKGVNSVKHKSIKFDHDDELFEITYSDKTNEQLNASQCAFYIVKGLESYIELYTPDGKTERIYNYASNQKELEKFLIEKGAKELKERGVKELEKDNSYWWEFIMFLVLLYVVLEL
jgi:hypothetical protein